MLFRLAFRPISVRLDSDVGSQSSVDQLLRTFLRRAVLLGTPLTLLSLEIRHPVFSSVEELLPSADRWLSRRSR